MQRIDSLVKDITQARHYNEMTGANIPRRIRLILGDAAGVCLKRSDIDAYLVRAETLIRKFKQLFPTSAEVFLLRAPGRINLIGEHTDYNGLPVLPIAINRDIMLAVALRHDTTVEIHNLDARFEPRIFEISENIKPYPAGDWGNYAKASVQALQSFFSESFCSDYLKGLNIVIDGNIPMAGGLASSSALVVAFAIALLHANRQDLTRLELAKLLAKGEQYVGTRGGGMDQAVCLLAEEGCALKVEFFPMNVEQIPIPRGFSFVVCHSTIATPKSSATRLAYNLRSAESRLAAAALGAALAKAGHAQPNRAGTIVMNRLGDLYSKNLNLSESEIDALVGATLKKQTYSLDEVARLLGLNVADARNSCLAAFTDEEVNSLGSMKLLSRCRHVLSEGRRVRKAAECLRGGQMREFGKLMYDSHVSCARDFEISTPELDALVEIAEEAGALGSRLTGAGFGGCVISLVHTADISKFISQVREKYYGRYLSVKRPEQGPELLWTDLIFVCKAVGGADELFA